MSAHLPRRGMAALALLAVILLAALGWALLRVLMPPAAAGPPARLLIATNTEYLGACPVMAAQSQGFFAQQGLTVQVLPFSSGKEALNAVLVGKAQVATAADIAIMFAALERQPIRIISTIYRVERDHGVVARRDAGIQAPADLKGKRIGVTMQTSGHFTLDAYLNLQRLAESQVQLVNYKPEQLMPALLNHEVDAVAGWDPFLQAITAQLGTNALRFSGQEVYESIYNLVTTDNYLQQNKGQMVQLLLALRDGEQFCRQYPMQASAFLRRMTQGRRDAMLQAWPDNHFALELDQDLLLALEDQARWALKSQFSSRREAPNFLDYVYLDGLNAVSPSEVTIIH